MPIKSIFHINVNCSNFARSKVFYEKLGFKSVYPLPNGSDPEMMRGLGLPVGIRANATLMMLDPEDKRSARLDLIEWQDPPTLGSAYPSLHHAGIARIALYTTAMDAEIARLRDEGVEFMSEPVTMHNGVRFVCLKDPDGSVIELLEVP